MSYGPCRSCKIAIKSTAPACPNCGAGLPILDEFSFRFRTEGPPIAVATLLAFGSAGLMWSFGSALNHMGPLWSELGLCLLAAIPAVLIGGIAYLIATLEMKPDDAPDAPGGIAALVGIVSAVLLKLSFESTVSRTFAASLAGALIGLLLGLVAGIVIAVWWGKECIPKQGGKPWLEIEKSTNAQLASLEHDSAFLASTRERVLREGSTPRTLERLTVLDEAERVVAVARAQATTRIWHVHLLRWHTHLEKHLASTSPTTAQDCDYARAYQDWLRQTAEILRAEWQASSIATSPSGARCIARLEQLLDVVERMRQAVIDRQVVLASRLARSSAAADDAAFTQLLRELRHVDATIIQSELSEEDLDSNIVRAEYALVQARAEVDGWVSPSDRSLELAAA